MPGTQWIYENHCVQGKGIEVAFKGNIRKDQSLAISKLMKYDLGILKAETGWGKTIATIIGRCERPFEKNKWSLC